MKKERLDLFDKLTAAITRRGQVEEEKAETRRYASLLKEIDGEIMALARELREEPDAIQVEFRVKGAAENG